MMLSKLKIGLAVLLSSGFVAGSGILAAQRLPDGEKPASSKSITVAPPTQKTEPREVVPAVVTNPFQPRSAPELAKARVEIALQRYKALKPLHNEGRITYDRLVAASKALMEAELDASGAKAARVEAVRAHYGRLQEILKFEQAQLEAAAQMADVAGSKAADVANVKSALLDTEFALARELEAPESKPLGADTKAGSPPPADARPADPKGVAGRDIGQERVVIARRIFKEVKRLYPAEIDVEDFLAAWKLLLEAEEDAATTKVGRVEAVQGQIDLLKSFLPAMEQLVKSGEKKGSDLDRLRLKILDTEAHLIKISRTPEGLSEGVAATPTEPPKLALTEPNKRQERVEVARRIFNEARRLYPGEITIVEMSDTSKTLMEAERDAAGSKVGRATAIGAHIERLKGYVAASEESLKRGKDVNMEALDQARLRLLEAEIALNKNDETIGPADLEHRVADLERKVDRLLKLLDASKR